MKAHGGGAIMLGSDTKIEWIEGMETADAMRRERKKDLTNIKTPPPPTLQE